MWTAAPLCVNEMTFKKIFKRSQLWMEEWIFQKNFIWIFTDKFFTGVTVKTVGRNFSLVFFSLIRTKCKGHFTVRERLKGGRGFKKTIFSFSRGCTIILKGIIPGMLLANMNISNNDPFHHCFHSCTAFILRGVIPMEEMDSFKSNYYENYYSRKRYFLMTRYKFNNA